MQVVNAVLYGGLAIAGIAFWWRRRTTPAAWLAATFVTLGIIVVQGLVVADPDPDVARAQLSAAEIYRDVIIIALLATPWLLFRFIRSLRPGRTLVDHLTDAGMAVMAVMTLVVPPLPGGGDPTPPWFTPYLIVLLLWWGTVMGSVTRMLWRAGRGQPGVVRRRMRLMSVAALSLNAALIASALSRGAETGSVADLLATALAWGGGIGFWLGVLPPGTLRRVWRAEDEIAMREAEVDLVRAETAEEAATAVVSATAALVGGSAARIEDADGRPLASFGEVDDGAGATLHVEGEASAVTISVSPYTPVFGQDEVGLLRQLCTHLDLALRRIHAYEASEAARLQTEQVNTDLQQLVYGISHDLRNPLVTILGFLQILDADVDRLSDHGRLAARRIGASAQYMDHLIQDLLTLSRIGRTDAQPAVVDLGPLVAEIAADVQARHEDVAVEVAADVQVLMNPVRARQLFTNLVENAARHGARRPLTIAVRSRDGDQGPVVEVADDGVGIPAAERERVFQIFQRLGGFDVESPGSGIGLTMCRRIVEDVGGSIEVVDADTGTTLRLKLPTPARSGTVAGLHHQGA